MECAVLLRNFKKPSFFIITKYYNMVSCKNLVLLVFIVFAIALSTSDAISFGKRRSGDIKVCFFKVNKRMLPRTTVTVAKHCLYAPPGHKISYILAYKHGGIKNFLFHHAYKCVQQPAYISITNGGVGQDRVSFTLQSDVNSRLKVNILVYASPVIRSEY